MAQLRCSDVTLGYEGTAVMEHLSFSVSAGDYLYIVGENGSGKSTLMKAILGLKSPMAGKIETGDGLKPDEIGYLPQQTAVQRDFPASVLDFLQVLLAVFTVRIFFLIRRSTIPLRLSLQKMLVTLLSSVGIGQSTLP